jgi:hypothetical protein
MGGERGACSEFKNKVKTIDARPSWRDKSVSSRGAGYHDNHTAETLINVGNELRRLLPELLHRNQLKH